MLDCEREPVNLIDRYAVVVIKMVSLLGHIPRKVLKLCSLL